MIEYYIDGSTKENMIGVGIVKVNEFGFVEKHHFNIEHINPSSMIAEGYSLEKTFELIQENDLRRNQLIDIYTDCQSLHQSLLFNEKINYTSNLFFTKQETNHYFQHLRILYIELLSNSSPCPMYHCEKSKKARPLIQIYFKDQADDKKLLQVAHSLSREYIKDGEKPLKVELKAIRDKNKWVIIKDNKDAVAENKRPIIALSEALQQLDGRNKEIIICNTLETILKSTLKNKIINKSMKSAMKTLEAYKLLVNQ